MDNKKGKLKIFFGYCAGVGKTYAMLKEAQLKYKHGIDVVIGYIEPHDRNKTEQNLLEIWNKLIKKKFHIKIIYFMNLM